MKITIYLDYYFDIIYGIFTAFKEDELNLGLLLFTKREENYLSFFLFNSKRDLKGKNESK